MAFWHFLYIKRSPERAKIPPKSDFRRPIMPAQRCKLNIKHVVLYVGYLYKPFWTKKIDRVGRGGQGRSKYCPEWASLLALEPSGGP